jgi:hypothetical protein
MPFIKWSQPNLEQAAKSLIGSGAQTIVFKPYDTEELAEAAGIVVDDDTPLDTEEMLEQRDLDRWELDPSSDIDR